jgi:hypothetical protein
MKNSHANSTPMQRNLELELADGFGEAIPNQEKAGIVMKPLMKGKPERMVKKMGLSPCTNKKEYDERRAEKKDAFIRNRAAAADLILSALMALCVLFGRNVVTMLTDQPVIRKLSTTPFTSGNGEILLNPQMIDQFLTLSLLQPKIRVMENFYPMQNAVCNYLL